MNTLNSKEKAISLCFDIVGRPTITFMEIYLTLPKNLKAGGRPAVKRTLKNLCKDGYLVETHIKHLATPSFSEYTRKAPFHF